MMLLHFLASLSYSLVLDYPSGTDAAGVNYISPVLFYFGAGEALVLVEWPDAKVDIYLPGLPVMTFTKEDSVSLFTFKSKATVQVTFTIGFSYFVAAAPTKLSNTGSILYISNLDSNELSFTNVNKDIYLSFADDYILKGEASSSYGNIEFNGVERKNNNNYDFTEEYSSKSFEYPPFRFKSSFRRKSSSSSITVKGKEKNIIDFTPDVPTTYIETWDSTSSSTLYHSNCAYGGENGIIQIPLKKNVLFISIFNKITIDSYLKVVVSYPNNKFDRIVERKKKFIYGNLKSMTGDVYFNNELCVDEHIAGFSSSTSREPLNFTYFDVPDKCKPRYGLPAIPEGAKHFLCFDLNDISGEKKIEFVISFESGKRYEIPHQYIELGSIEKFTVTVYVTVPDLCNQVEYLTYESTEEKMFFTINNGMVLMCDDKKEGLSKGAIAGIVIACVAVAGIITGIVIWRVKAHKKKVAGEALIEDNP